MTTRRAYAASLGLAKADARGRMSADAHAAIAKAEAGGMTFEDSAAPAKRAAVKAAPKAGAFDAKKVRAWAKSNGLEVNARGRLSAEILEAYRKGNPEVTPSVTNEHKTVSVGKDIRPHAPRTRSKRTEYVVWKNNKRIVLGEAEVCKCNVSLSHCRCGSPVWMGHDVIVRTR